MTIHHHPSDENIFAFAGGALDAALAAAMGAHLENCAQCRQTAALAATVGGLALEQQAPEPLSENALAQVMARLEAPVVNESLPVALRQWPAGRRRWLAPGIWVRPILKDKAAGTRLYLLGARPGKTLPRHGHDGVEMTQVLEGEFFDGGMRYGPGDFVEAGDGDEHAFTVGAGGPCVCVIASHGVPRGLPGLLMRMLA